MIQHLFFLDSKTGWLAADQATLMRTDDGGVSWQTVSTPLPPEARLQQVVFADRQRGWLRTGTPQATAWRTSDGGTSWQVTQAPLQGVVRVDLASGQTVVLTGRDTNFGVYELSAISEDGGLN